MPKLKTDIEINALIRRAEQAGAYAMILHRGDKDAGAFAVVTRQFGASSAWLYQAGQDATGGRIWWAKGPLLPQDLQKLLQDRRAMDSDLWVVEIEDHSGRHFLLDPVETV